ncbi:recombinase family protein [Roseomonas nepalensis]|uniref:Recombinase family protein n=1 Tax=Muricoccus nepalensis TaxID=1854500 RepID=A0A502ENH8_9PROT|nr:recombinase family protein [Roseomonas nepalensis]TPG38060.1 recombinase family protein [Roseomonas nepalensis]
MAAPRRLATTQPRYAVALYRVSTAEQGHSGFGLEAQQASVRAFVEREGWTLVAEHQDIASGKDDRRPGFQAALTRCRQLGAVLVAARLDRIIPARLCPDTSSAGPCLADTASVLRLCRVWTDRNICSAV